MSESKHIKTIKWGYMVNGTQIMDDSTKIMYVSKGKKNRINLFITECYLIFLGIKNKLLLYPELKYTDSKDLKNIIFFKYNNNVHVINFATQNVYILQNTEEEKFKNTEPIDISGVEYKLIMEVKDNFELETYVSSLTKDDEIKLSSNSYGGRILQLNNLELKLRVSNNDKMYRKNVIIGEKPKALNILETIDNISGSVWVYSDISDVAYNNILSNIGNNKVQQPQYSQEISDYITMCYNEYLGLKNKLKKYPNLASLYETKKNIVKVNVNSTEHIIDFVTLIIKAGDKEYTLAYSPDLEHKIDETYCEPLLDFERTYLDLNYNHEVFSNRKYTTIKKSVLVWSHNNNNFTSEINQQITQHYREFLELSKSKSEINFRKYYYFKVNNEEHLIDFSKVLENNYEYKAEDINNYLYN
jgi:hypothetical protein